MEKAYARARLYVYVISGFGSPHFFYLHILSFSPFQINLSSKKMRLESPHFFFLIFPHFLSSLLNLSSKKGGIHTQFRDPPFLEVKMT